MAGLSIILRFLLCNGTKCHRQTLSKVYCRDYRSVGMIKCTFTQPVAFQKRPFQQVHFCGEIFKDWSIPPFMYIYVTHLSLDIIVVQQPIPIETFSFGPYFIYECYMCHRTCVRKTTYPTIMIMMISYQQKCVNLSSWVNDIDIKYTIIKYRPWIRLQKYNIKQYVWCSVDNNRCIYI